MSSHSAGRTHPPKNHHPSSSTTTSTSHHSPSMSDEEDPTPTPLLLKALPSSTRTPVVPIREDCWTENATHTLIDAWGSHHLQLNRSGLRHQDWQEICDAVNALHAHSRKLHRTEIQCKNRIDTLKKKYKVEKQKSLQSDGRHVSTWPFFDSLDDLIGEKFPKSNPTTPSLAAARTRRSSTQVERERPVLPLLSSSVPVGLRSKRLAPKPVEEDDGEGSDWTTTTTPAWGAGGVGKRKRTVGSGAGGDMVAEGFMKLAEAIGGFAEVYEKVEGVKQRQMVELEKQRMQFAKDIEIQRMKLFMESKVELEKLKRTKGNSPSGGYKS